MSEFTVVYRLPGITHVNLIIGDTKEEAVEAFKVRLNKEYGFNVADAISYINVEEGDQTEELRKRIIASQKKHEVLR
jgi:hypothetical protein